MQTMKYDFTTAEAVCNDQQENTWEVRARGTTDAKWWTVSDSSKLTQAEAESEAADMRDAAR